MNIMKKIFALTICSLILSSAWANDQKETPLNKVILPLNAEQWLTTKTALVSVSVNAAVADQGIEKVRGNVMQKLLQIASKGDWHVVSFNRQQDPSGLESVQISAQARLDQVDLNGLRNKAKSISKAGETYTISSIEFTPSNDEIRVANTALRANIYQQAKTEIDSLNAMYPTQKYYLHKIDFMMMGPMPVAMQKNAMYAADMAAPAMAVGDKASMSATVEIASTPDMPTPTKN
jgi:hypothetical protein